MNIRQMMKDWISRWEKLSKSDLMSRIHQKFFNSPEGCVSVVQDYAANGSLQNLSNSVGALPESILKYLAR
jgi:hypothetical protein